MKIRSQALYQFLRQRAVLDGPADAIARAKAEYRKLYKRQWKERRHTGREIRIQFTARQFEAIRSQAARCGFRHTPYARKAVLAYLESGIAPLPEEALLRALQLLGMASIALSKEATVSAEITSRLSEAERLLLEIVRVHINR